jgi:putrescine aminotransferase
MPPPLMTRQPSPLPGASRRSEPELNRGAVVDIYRRHVNRGQARLAQFLGLPLEVEAAGVEITADDGRTYLDCGGYGVFLMGHRHPAVVAAVARQLQRQPLSSRLFLNGPLAAASEQLARHAPDGLDRVAFTNSGAEAVELALKLGRASGRPRIVAALGGFHGKTMGALSATGRPRYRDPFRPLLPLVEHVPFGDAAAMDAVLREGPAATVIIEPVQAEGGVRLPPDGYLREVHRSADRHGALLVADEIQTGLGRLGHWWGCDADGVAPDVLLCGKALSGGVVPVAAVVCTEDAYAPLNDEPLLHSSTFAGNPLAAVAAHAALEVIDGENLVDAVGHRLLQAVQRAVTDEGDGVVTDVRGRGLLIGVELAREHHAALLLEELLAEGVIVSYSLNADAVVRLTPPALLEDPHIDRVAGALAASLRRLKEGW